MKIFKFFMFLILLSSLNSCFPFDFLVYNFSKEKTNVNIIKKLKEIDEDDPFFAYVDYNAKLPDSSIYLGTFNTECYGRGMFVKNNKAISIEMAAKNIGGNCVVISETDPSSFNNCISGRIYKVNDYPNTNLSEEKIIEIWKNKKIDKYEGIFEFDLNIEDDYLNKYYAKFAIHKSNEFQYEMIYLSGFEAFPEYINYTNMKKSWREGDIYAILDKTDTENLFNMKMYEYNKKSTYSSMLQHENSYLKIFTFSGLQRMRKIYPEKAENQNIVASLTGFAIDNEHILTCYHGLKNKSAKILVKGINGDMNNQYKAKLEKFDKENDLAVLKLESLDNKVNLNPYQISSTDINVSLDVFVLGYPASSYLGEDIKYTSGIISSISGAGGNSDLYQFTAPVQPGNSGSPIFDFKGNLIGMVNSGIRLADNVGYAIKLNKINEFLTKNYSKSLGQVSTSSDNVETKNKISTFKNQVYLIEISDDYLPQYINVY